MNKDQSILTADTLIKYIDDLMVISGKDLLDKCVELGASPETKDYN